MVFGLEMGENREHTWKSVLRNIDPDEHTVSNGTDKGELLETVMRLETELRATLTEQ